MEKEEENDVTERMLRVCENEVSIKNVSIWGGVGSRGWQLRSKGDRNNNHKYNWREGRRGAKEKKKVLVAQNEGYQKNVLKNSWKIHRKKTDAYIENHPCVLYVVCQGCNSVPGWRYVCGREQSEMLRGNFFCNVFFDLSSEKQGHDWKCKLKWRKGKSNGKREKKSV